MMMDSTIFLQYYLCILLEGLGGGGGVGGSCNIIKENIHNNIMKEFFFGNYMVEIEFKVSDLAI